MDMEKKKHLVMSPFPAQGHLNAMVRLAWSILDQSSDFHITLVHCSAHSPPQYGAKNSLLHLEGIPEGQIPASVFKSLNGNASLGFLAAVNAAQEMQKPLERVIAELQTDGEVVCIISDSFLSEWNQDMADRLRIPLACLWTASATSCIIAYQFNELIKMNMFPVREKLREYGNIRLDGIPGLGDFHLADLPYGFYDTNLDEISAFLLSRMKDAAWILVSTIESIELTSMNTMRALHPKTLAVALDMYTYESDVEHDECLQWLDKQEPNSVIYISFGTLASLSAAQIEEIAVGVEMSGVAFLWALRDGFALDGRGAALEEFIERTRTQGRGMVVPWAPQVQVLNHPATGLFLSHCGWNSTLEGLRAGVPFLAWPCDAEQNMNAKSIIQEWKIGLPLRDSQDLGPTTTDNINGVTRDRIKQVISSAMKDEELRENVKRLRVSLETSGSFNEAGLSTFLQELRQGSL